MYMYHMNISPVMCVCVLSIGYFFKTSFTIYKFQYVELADFQKGDPNLKGHLWFQPLYYESYLGLLLRIVFSQNKIGSCIFVMQET